MTPTIVVRDGGVTRVAGPGVTIAVAGGAVASVDGLVGVVSLPTNAAAGTGSKRTLGTGATEAAAGNHGHVLSALTNLTPFMAQVLALSDDSAEAQANLGFDVSALLPRALTINPYTASRTGAAADLDALAKMSSASDLVYTIPAASTYAWPTGRSAYIMRAGPGALSVVPAPGVTIRYAGGLVTGKYVEDTFTGADATALASHTGEIGATWTNHPSYTAGAKILGNRLEGGTASRRYYASAVPASADYDVEGIAYCGSTTTARTAGVIGRMDTSADTNYALFWNSTTGEVLLQKIVGGTATTLGTPFALPVVAAASHTLRLVMRGTQISGYVDGVLQIGPVTDSAVTAAGRVGVRTNSSAAVGLLVDSILAAPDADNVAGTPSLVEVNSVVELVALGTNEFLLIGDFQVPA